MVDGSVGFVLSAVSAAMIFEPGAVTSGFMIGGHLARLLQSRRGPRLLKLEISDTVPAEVSVPGPLTLFHAVRVL